MVDIDNRLVVGEIDALRLGTLLLRAARDFDANDEFFLATWSQLFTLHGKLQIALSCLHHEGECQYIKAVSAINGGQYDI